MIVTIDTIRKEVARLDPKLDVESDGYKAAVVLLSSLQVGPNIKRTAKFAQYPRAKVARFSRNLRKSGVWRGGKLYVEWFEEKNGGIAFWMDVCVAEGLMARIDE